MTGDRRQELLDKIEEATGSENIVTNIEKDIKLYREEGNGKIVIDLLVYWMRENEEKPDTMDINYAASNSPFKQPEPEHEAMQLLLAEHVKSTIKRLEMPNEETKETERDQIA